MSSSLIDATHTVLEDADGPHEDLVVKFSGGDSTQVEYFMRRYWRCALLSAIAQPASANVGHPESRHETVKVRRFCTVTTRVPAGFLQTEQVAGRGSSCLSTV